MSYHTAQRQCWPSPIVGTGDAATLLSSDGCTERPLSASIFDPRQSCCSEVKASGLVRQGSCKGSSFPPPPTIQRNLRIDGTSERAQEGPWAFSYSSNADWMDTLSMDDAADAESVHERLRQCMIRDRHADHFWSVDRKSVLGPRRGWRLGEGIAGASHKNGLAPPKFWQTLSSLILTAQPKLDLPWLLLFNSSFCCVKDKCRYFKSWST